jgi:hypothetical protein
VGYTTWGPGGEPELGPIRYHVDRLVDAPRVARGRYIGEVGELINNAEGNRPIGLEFDGGHRAWFREDEVTLLQQGKAYPF